MTNDQTARGIAGAAGACTQPDHCGKINCGSVVECSGCTLTRAIVAELDARDREVATSRQIASAAVQQSAHVAENRIHELAEVGAIEFEEGEWKECPRGCGHFMAEKRLAEHEGDCPARMKELESALLVAGRERDEAKLDLNLLRKLLTVHEATKTDLEAARAACAVLQDQLTSIRGLHPRCL